METLGRLGLVALVTWTRQRTVRCRAEESGRRVGVAAVSIGQRNTSIVI